ncbi:unnamed protein product [Polarella glacialis]|uniref:Uncharacterized protein n=1 Tax=Polarella glacialis TaxID=89957 RepID=A0A813IGN1_POLGL|nr:unnamed protein product [Polarella glacialis]
MFPPIGSLIFQCKSIPTAAIRASSNELTQQAQLSALAISAFASTGKISRLQTIASVSFACSEASGEQPKAWKWGLHPLPSSKDIAVAQRTLP